jgi:hypothetical protein
MLTNEITKFNTFWTSNLCRFNTKHNTEFTYHLWQITPEGSTEKAELDRNPEGARRYGRPRKTWRQVKRVKNDKTKWKNFTSSLCSVRSNRR